MTREALLENYIPEPNTGCWFWLGAIASGYGHVRYQGRDQGAHRVFYELLRGPIPEGLTIDHLCRQPSCVNPDHLEPVTMRENVIRGTGPSAANARKTHCRNGHELNADNMFMRRGTRQCRMCKNAYQRLWIRTKPRSLNRDSERGEP